MTVIETLRELSEVWRLFGDMPDDSTLSVDLAALYLGVSVKTLARYRQNGGGPQYIQYQSDDSKARNQRVNYLLKDLRSWRDNHKVNNTMHAAQVRGLAFNSLIELCEPQPFWKVKILPDNDWRLVSHALTIYEEDFKNLLFQPNADIVWISVEEALFSEWQNADERKKWNDTFIEFLNAIISASNAAQEKHILNVILK
ncbi:hypothetical protein [Yersinia intermedia]|uniref:hypothetical protein n=1 Tax=Yersinia intermedia TaxID=631 RepID=UPI0005ACF82B|nr:hypothetical protein [Yersinia intermedia]AJJ21348.1 hypothetical protein CH53_917 [Yersinia intermedia]